MIAKILVVLVAVITYCSAFRSISFLKSHLSRTNRIELLQLHAKTKHKVTIQHEGVDSILEVDEDTSILEAALDAGIELPHDCKLGVCLTCPSKLVSGQLDQSTSSLDVSVQSKGYALTCMSYPRSDCVVRSIDEDELISAQFSDRST